MEPCIAKFLDSCDPNGDHQVTLVEWGKCLNVDKGKLFASAHVIWSTCAILHFTGELEDKCVQFGKLAL